MADLDDFFAKKDKKKTKSKKFLTAEELAKKLEDTSKKATEPLKVKKERPTPTIASNVNEIHENNVEEKNQEDEWKEFEQEERKDYSGLKIGQLTITEDDNQTNSTPDLDSTGDGASDAEGGGTSNKTSDKKVSGPWKKLLAGEETTELVIEEPEKEVKPASKVYMAPALRNQPLKSMKNRHRDAPDITNEEYFPTLGAARPEEQRKKKNEPAFEEVRHGSRVTRFSEVKQQTPPISVGNRFKSLADDDS